MSRGFVKESDQEELPIIPPRAPLPDGVTNYVTPTGYAQLEAEREALEGEKAALPGDHEEEHRRALTVLDGKLALLLRRLQSARIIDPADQPDNEVRFGARVVIQPSGSNRKQEFQIVGVDEANVKDRKIAFTAPIARAITGRWAGETAELRLGGELRQIKVISIQYGA